MVNDIKNHINNVFSPICIEFIGLGADEQLDTGPHQQPAAAADLRTDHHATCGLHAAQEQELAALHRTGCAW